MRTYICDYELVSFHTVENAIRRAFPKAVVICSNLMDEASFEVRVYDVGNLDMLNDIMAEYELQ